MTGLPLSGIAAAAFGWQAPARHRTTRSGARSTGREAAAAGCVPAVAPAPAADDGALAAPAAGPAPRDVAIPRQGDRRREADARP